MSRPTLTIIAGANGLEDSAYGHTYLRYVARFGRFLQYLVDPGLPPCDVNFHSSSRLLRG